MGALCISSAQSPLRSPGLVWNPSVNWMWKEGPRVPTFTGTLGDPHSDLGSPLLTWPGRSQWAGDGEATDSILGGVCGGDPADMQGTALPAEADAGAGGSAPRGSLLDAVVGRARVHVSGRCASMSYPTSVGLSSVWGASSHQASHPLGTHPGLSCHSRWRLWGQPSST